MMGRYLDHATPQERLIFTRRGQWRRKPLLLPLIFLAFVLYFFVLPAFGAKPVMGATGKASFWCVKDYKEIVRWCNYFTEERR